MHSWFTYFFYFKTTVIPEIHRELFRKYFSYFVKYQEVLLAASEQPTKPNSRSLMVWQLKQSNLCFETSWDGSVNVYVLEYFKIILESTCNNLQKNIQSPLPCSNPNELTEIHKIVVEILATWQTNLRYTLGLSCVAIVSFGVAGYCGYKAYLGWSAVSQAYQFDSAGVDIAVTTWLKEQLANGVPTPRLNQTQLDFINNLEPSPIFDRANLIKPLTQSLFDILLENRLRLLRMFPDVNLGRLSDMHNVQVLTGRVYDWLDRSFHLHEQALQFGGRRTGEGDRMWPTINDFAVSFWTNMDLLHLLQSSFKNKFTEWSKPISFDYITGLAQHGLRGIDQHLPFHNPPGYYWYEYYMHWFSQLPSVIQIVQNSFLGHSTDVANLLNRSSVAQEVLAQSAEATSNLTRWAAFYTTGAVLSFICGGCSAVVLIYKSVLYLFKYHLLL